MTGPRACLTCALELAPHQTLCPRCRTTVPSDAGPVAPSAEGSSIAVSAPPPRAAPRPAAPDPDPDDEPTVAAPPEVEPTVDASRAPEPTAVAGPAPVARPMPPDEATWGAPGTPSSAPEPTVVADCPGSGEAHTPEAPSRPDPSGGWPPVQPTPSAGTLGQPGAPVLDERGNLPGGLLGLVGAALVVVGVVLPWMDVAGEMVSGWAASDDAKVLLGLAGVAALAGALVVGGARSLVLRVLLAVLGVVAVGFAGFEVRSVSGVEDLDPSPGLGLYVGLIGGVVLLAAAGLTRHRRFR